MSIFTRLCSYCSCCWPTYPGTQSPPEESQGQIKLLTTDVDSASPHFPAPSPRISLKQKLSGILSQALLLYEQIRKQTSSDLIELLLIESRRFACAVNEILEKSEKIHHDASAPLEDESSPVISGGLLVHELRAPLQGIISSLEMDSTPSTSTLSLEPSF